MDPLQAWYRAPLNGSDILAGGLLVILPIVFIIFYILVIIVLWKASKEIIGFRFLLSSAIADILVIILYGLIDGVAILTKSPIVNKDGRRLMHFFLEWFWFACCFHLPLIAWSRLHAIFAPLSFRHQKQWASYGVCVVCTWLLSLIVTFAITWQPFHVTFYYEPALYGTTAEDFLKYQRDGHSQVYFGIHIIVVVLPFIFYSLTIAILIKHRIFVGSVKTENASGNKLRSVESKLIIPCILVTIVFAIGQVAISMGTGSGPWAMWAVCFIFFINSAMQPVLLVAFSPTLRKGVVDLLPLLARKESRAYTTRTVNSITRTM